MRKQLMLLCSATLLAISAMAQDHPSVSTSRDLSNEKGKFSFREETHDFGNVPEGPLAECDFEFTNSGSAPIVITEAHGSCGCTVPQWPHEPIAPGSSGKIHVSYTTNGRQGSIQKDVIIASNAEQQPMTLHIRGLVQPKQSVASQSGPAAGK